ncbi:MAG: hypothetical protein ABIJ39_03155 [Chloroflexota bacterium]
MARHFVLPQSGHFDGHEHRLVFVQRKLLKRNGGICPIMIGNGRQTKLLSHQVLQ